MTTSVQADEAWDAGDMGCGELVFLLAQRLSGMQAGKVLRLTAADPGARHDIPAWCRLTGNRLLAADHPHFLIQRKES